MLRPNGGSPSPIGVSPNEGSPNGGSPIGGSLSPYHTWGGGISLGQLEVKLFPRIDFGDSPPPPLKM